MSYEDIEEAQAKRAAKEVKRGKGNGSRKRRNVAAKEDDFEPPLEPMVARIVDAPQLGIAPVARMY